MPNFHTEEAGENLTITLLKDRADAAYAQKAKPELRRILQNTQCEQVEIQMEKVGFIDSSGIGLLLNILRRFPDKVTLKETTPQVQAVLTLLRLDKLFQTARN